MPPAVRLLVNNPDVNQRGTIVDVPGTLTDILPDPARNRFYILRQDQNQLLVFDGGTNQQITDAAHRHLAHHDVFHQRREVPAGGPQRLAAGDGVRSGRVAARVSPMVLPGGHYGRSLAASNAALLVLARDEGTGNGRIDNINLRHRHAYELADAGSLPEHGFDQGRSDRRRPTAHRPDGRAGRHVMLYSADADTFTVSRKDSRRSAAPSPLPPMTPTW